MSIDYSKPPNYQANDLVVAQVVDPRDINNGIVSHGRIYRVARLYPAPGFLFDASALIIWLVDLVGISLPPGQFLNAHNFIKFEGPADESFIESIRTLSTPNRTKEPA
jgi:hypothetical protein